MYELPFGRGKRMGSSWNPIVNGVLGGWQLSGINSFTSGAPLSISVPGATLGNGWGTRANLAGDPHVSNPNAGMWFNTAAFSRPAQYRFGSSGIGILDVNLGNPGTSLGTSTFGKILGAGGARTVQLGLKFLF